MTRLVHAGVHGMSRSARKRAARLAVIDRAILQVPLQSYLYKLYRAEYRIKERLRSCACAACRPMVHLSIRSDSLRIQSADRQPFESVESPWGWSVGPTDPIKYLTRHRPLPAGAPVRLIYEGTGVAKVAYYVKGTEHRAWVQLRFLSTQAVRLCDGSGLLPAIRRCG